MLIELLLYFLICFPNHGVKHKRYKFENQIGYILVVTDTITYCKRKEEGGKTTRSEYKINKTDHFLLKKFNIGFLSQLIVKFIRKNYIICLISIAFFFLNLKEGT